MDEPKKPECKNFEPVDDNGNGGGVSNRRLRSRYEYPDRLKLFIDVGAKLGTILLAAFGSLLWMQVTAVLDNVDAVHNIAIVNDKRLSIIESNRYTAVDAVRDNTLMTKQIQELQIWMRDNYPPKYLVDDVTQIKLDIREIQRQLRIKVTVPSVRDGDNGASTAPTNRTPT